MTRTQISLTEDQHRFLVSLSRQTGESISALIRKAVDELRNKQSTPRQKALKLLGRFEADRTDISTNHDEFLWGNPVDPTR